MTIEELKVLITAETSGLRKEVQKVKDSLNSLQSYTTKSTKSMTNSFKALGKTIASSLGIFALIKLGKQAIETASDIQEVQNVVEQSFGDATDEINYFASQAMKAFGLTELQAKKTASTLMAMSNGMNINTQAGKIMAVNLTKLSGDMASFYNVSQDVAETALHSVFTGETESLKKFGIVLTDANLQAFAYTKGINKQISAMTQAEKVALRYRYVMESTSKAQGDFARTSGNWANQVRILTGQFNQLKSILGSGLIGVLTPILSILNQILASLIAIANSFAKIFGGTGIKQVSSTIAGASANVGGMAENFEDANSSAKKLKKTIAGFDELEILNGNSNSGANIGGGAGSDMMVQDYYGDIVDSEAQNKSFNDMLKTFNDNINKYFDKIVAFGGELANKFNSAFKSIDWVLLGETVANSLNLVYNTANNFLETADWLELGQSFATGLNSMFANLDWGAIGQNLADRLNAIGNVIYGFVDTLDWVGLGEGLKTKFITTINGIDWALIGSAFGKGLTGIFTTLNTFLDGGAIENLGFKISEAINNALMNIDATAMGQGIHNLTSQLIIAFENIDWKLLGTKIREFLQSVDLIGIIKDWFSAITDNIASVVAGALNIPEEVADVIVDVGFAIAGLAKVLGAVLPLAGGLIEVGANLKILGVNIPIISSLCKEIGSLGGLFKSTTGEVGLFKGVFDGVKTLLGEIGTEFSPILLGMQNAYSSTVNTLGASTGVFTQVKGFVAGLGGGFKGLWAVMKAHPIGAIITVLGIVITSMVELYNKSETFRNFINGLWSNLKEIFGEIGQTLSDLWKEHLEPLFSLLGGALSDMWDSVQTVIGWVVGILGGTLLTTVASVFSQILKVVSNVVGGIADMIVGAIGFLDGLLTFLTGDFSGGFSKVCDGLKKFWQGFCNALPGFIKNPINQALGFVNGLIKGIVSGINAVIRNINKLSWKVPDWVPGIGGQQWGFNFKTITAPQIPYLANGGVIEQPTVAMMGEYAGASNNPEIVAPQKLLTQIFNSQIEQLIPVLVEQTTRTIQAIENIDMEVKIGDEAIAKSAQRGNKSHIMRTGQPIFSY